MIDRQNVIDSILEMFNDFGLDITMDDIAERMHISKKTLYRLFKTKEELMMTVCEYALSTTNEYKREILEQDLPLDEKMSQVMHAVPDKLKNIDLGKVEGLWKKYPAAKDMAARYMNESWDCARALLNQGVKEGIFREVDDRLLKVCVSSTIDTLFDKGTLSELGMSHDEAMEKLVKLIMNGIRK